MNELKQNLVENLKLKEDQKKANCLAENINKYVNSSSVDEKEFTEDFVAISYGSNGEILKFSKNGEIISDNNDNFISESEVVGFFANELASWKMIKAKNENEVHYGQNAHILHDNDGLIETAEYTFVPSEMAGVAIELQELRRKYEGNSEFNFTLCDYKKKIINVIKVLM